MNALFRKGQLFIHRWRWERATLHARNPAEFGHRPSPWPPRQRHIRAIQARGQPVSCRVPPGNSIRG
jgi:hypothetical protein